MTTTEQCQTHELTDGLLLEEHDRAVRTVEAYANGEQVYHHVLDAAGQAVDLDMMVYDGEVDLNYQLKMTDLYSAGAIRATNLEKQAVEDSELLSFDKLETGQEVNAFKVRGAFMGCLLALQQDPNIRDFVAVSAGNHGLGVAQFVQWFNKQLIASDPSLGLPENQHLLATAQVFCKEQASSEKVGMMEARDARVHRMGYSRLEDAGEGASNFVEQQNLKDNGRKARFIHPFDQPEVMAGQSLVLLETLHQLREQGVDAKQRPLELFVGGGGFGLANGNAVLMDHLISLGLLHPDSRVIAVQMEDCDAMNRALQRLQAGRTDMDGLFVNAQGKDTFDPAADGTAVLTPGNQSLALAHYLRQRGRLSVMTVSKAELGATMRHNRAYGKRVEPAGALAATGRLKCEQAIAPYYYNYPEYSRRITVAVESGGNVSDDTLKEFYETYPDETVLADGALRRVALGMACVSGATAAYNSIL